MIAERINPNGLELTGDVRLSKVAGAKLELALSMPDVTGLNTPLELTVVFVTPGVTVDGGGYIITPHGVIPIPPWDPSLQLEFVELANLAASAHRVENPEVQQAIKERIAPVLKSRAERVMEQFVRSMSPELIDKLQGVERATVIVG